jgi:Mg/Co/Ni transporter MgtE
MNDILDEAASPDLAAPAAGLAREHPADIVERLNAESIDTASAALSALPLERAAEVFDARTRTRRGTDRGAAARACRFSFQSNIG